MKISSFWNLLFLALILFSFSFLIFSLLPFLLSFVFLSNLPLHLFLPVVF
jgi:hypothetical protein